MNNVQINIQAGSYNLVMDLWLSFAIAFLDVILATHIYNNPDTIKANEQPLIDCH